VLWDGETPGDWTSEIDGADAVINLAGQSVNCRYNATNRRAITDSRVKSTRIVGEAIARAKPPPRVWLQASTATIYAHRDDGGNDEATGFLGGEDPNAPDTWRFSIDVATSWERPIDQVQVSGTRKVKLRTAIVMSPEDGGAFDILLRLVRFGLEGAPATAANTSRGFTARISLEPFSG
jgi:NAD dependent epimerase/dehydratase family enzyme